MARRGGAGLGRAGRGRARQGPSLMASLYLFAAAAIPALVGYLAARGLSRLAARWGGDAMIDALIRRNAAATSSRTRSADQAVDWGALNRSEEHTSELQSQSNLVWRLPLEKKIPNTPHLHHHVRPALAALLVRLGVGVHPDGAVRRFLEAIGVLEVRILFFFQEGPPPTPFSLPPLAALLPA